MPVSSPLVTLEEVISPLIKGVEGFVLRSDSLWGVLGGNGSGKSTFARMLRDANPALRAQIVSFEEEQKLLEREIYDDDSEFFDVDHGRTTRELIEEHRDPSVEVDKLISTLGLEGSIDTGFKLLSTGERRRMILARALSQAPGLLILDEPFDGLDTAFTGHLQKVLAAVSTPMVFVVNRLSHLPERCTHLGYLKEMHLLMAGPRNEVESSLEFKQLHSVGNTVKKLPSAFPNTKSYVAKSGQPIVDLCDIKVAYSNRTVLKGLDWRILPGEHWKVSGPNGCGKSTLVNLISGDHPQCYSNEVHLFGAKRGVGESIWDVKHYMGLMSNTLHQQYRITVTAETVLLSGFFDTIGVYRPVGVAHRKVVAEWLEFLQLTKHKHTHFQKLSFGQQRMLLIARSLIKRPYLLILDEPCQGLDPLNRALVIQLIEEIVSRKVAQIIYISHEPEDRLSCITHELCFVPNCKNETGYEIEKMKL